MNDSVFISLGSNLGDRFSHLAFAREQLQRVFMTFSVSQILETEPLYGVSQPSFLNQIIKGQTNLSPWALLSFSQQIERTAGRFPFLQKNMSRTLDVDLIDYRGMCLNHPRLILPHPRAHERWFIRELVYEIC